MNQQQKTEIIAFFSAHGYFKLRSPAKQLIRLQEVWNDFKLEFPVDNSTMDWSITSITNLLQEYQAEKQKTKQARERAKIAKQESLPLTAGNDTAFEHVETLPHGRYVLTCAQNNTDVNPVMLACLQQFCKENNAKLIIGKMTYNKSGFQNLTTDSEEAYYDQKLKPYLTDKHLSLANVFHFIGNANILPTVKNSLTGFDGITKAGIHTIIPASKIALKVVAALKNAPTKILASTGTITKRNYIPKRAGTVAAIEHNIGAIFVDTETGSIRHLELMENSEVFYDLKKMYSVNGVFEVEENVEIFQPGDIHAEKMTDINLKNTVELIEFFDPNNIVIHDGLDFSSRNHHNKNDPAFIHVQHVNNQTVAGDLKAFAKVIHALVNSISQRTDIHIIESNHDLALLTWLKYSDFKEDPVNAVTYLTCMLELYKHQEKEGNSNFNMLKFAYTKIGKGKHSQRLTFHEIDESVILAGIECGCHGHNGVNGARGSPVSFRTLGVAMNTGHTHSPSIYGRVYTAGVTASLEMGYNLGASSWAIAHIVTYVNGQRQIIFA